VICAFGFAFKTGCDTGADEVRARRPQHREEEGLLVQEGAAKGDGTPLVRTRLPDASLHYRQSTDH
jgi:hypothetical protein